MKNLKTQGYLTGCEVVGISPDLSCFDALPEPYRTRSIKSHKRDVISDGINKETNFKPEYSHNSTQRKYLAVFEKDSSGRWVYYFLNLYFNRDSVVGSRLVNDSYETARHFAEVILKEDLMDHE